MHVPDGFFDVPTSLATGGAAAAVVAVALQRSKAELGERVVPLAGLVAAYVFAVQMLNFPVGVGTSGHLMGGTLAAVLVGPWTALLCLTVVLAVQALLFADGGLTALGTNVLLIGVVTVAVGWGVTRLVQGVLPRTPGAVVPAAFAGALLSVPAAALVFTGLFLVGGTTSVPAGTLAASMLAWHAVIGLGEAVITALTVSAVVAVRPDLVAALGGVQAPLLLRRPDGSTVEVQAASSADRPRTGPATARVLGAGAAVVLLLAGVASFFASGSPDGLERVAEDRGFLQAAKDHALGSWALADYGDVGGVPVGLAGVLGVVVTLTVGLALLAGLRARRRGDAGPHEVAGRSASGTRP